MPHRAWALLWREDIRRRLVAPITADSLTLLVNLLTGVLVARLLGTAGRGEIAAILTVTQMLGWFFSLGASQAAAFHIARNPSDGGRLITTWLSILLPVSLVAIAVGELLLPTLFDAQSAEALRYAQLFILAIAAYLVLDFMLGVLSGDHDFIALNVLKFSGPATIAVLYVTFWLTDSFTVETALIANVVATVAVTVATTIRAVARCGLRRPSRALGKSTVSYALRAHLGNIGGFMTARLDLMIIPAFLAASAVGLYSVATNVAAIIPTITGTFAIMVLPAAARAGKASVRTVIRSLHVTLAISVAVAIVIGVLADILIRLVYGGAFGDSATALRILLPGVVIDAMAAVLWSGLLADGYPARAAAGGLAGLLVTIVGLILVLPDGGIEGAALVSTLSYATALVVTVFIYKWSVKLPWRHFVKPPPAGA
jgi:O-antigen/teichoic acid export membrane protein